MALVLLDIDPEQGVATITLNRPECRNALSVQTLMELRAAITEADRDDQVGALVLTGVDPTFCAGLDLVEVGDTGGLALATEGRTAPWGATVKPLIGAINGAAITGGLELALNCDFLIASDRAAFADTHVSVGILPGWGLSVLLPERIGLPRAVQMSMTGNFVGASKALEWGLLNEVVAHEALSNRATEIAATIAGNDRTAAQGLLSSYRAIAEASGIANGLRMEAEVHAEWMSGFRPGNIAERRAAVIARGREQGRRTSR